MIYEPEGSYSIDDLWDRITSVDASNKPTLAELLHKGFFKKYLAYFGIELTIQYKSDLLEDFKTAEKE